VTTTAAALRLVVMAAIGLGAVGCAAPQVAPPSPAPAPASAAAPTSPAVVTPTVASPAPLPPAADGDDLSACADGTCEVRVVAGSVVPLPRRSGITARVAAVDASEVALSGTSRGGDYECQRCEMSVNFDAENSFDVKLSAGGDLRMGGVVVEAVALDTDAAVLRVRPA
jgi:hypothetical protein